MTTVAPTPAPATPWSLAARLLVRWIEKNERVDALLESLPRMPAVERGRCQSLLFGAVRHKGRIEGHLAKLVSRPPRPRLQSILLVAGYELIEGGDEHQVAKIVHHAVEQAKTLASPAEAKLVNAVVRKLAAAMAAEPVPPKLASAEVLAGYFSHPLWLVQRWLSQFGAAPTRLLLEWNQRPGPVFARWRLRDRGPTEEELTSLVPTPWKNFYEVKPGHWPAIEALLATGAVYLQDPATRLSIDLLGAQAGESILDTCAAPGGKSVAIADAMSAGGSAVTGRIVAMDLPGARIDRLKENLAKAEGVDVALIQADLLEAEPALFKEHGLPAEYQAVLIDVPCSNTGVMRHRVDVKWRLQENDFKKHARQQLLLLAAAARRVAPGGRLVYSSCSIDTEENERVVGAFVDRSVGRFFLEKSVISRPWENPHDGIAAFLLRRR